MVKGMCMSLVEGVYVYLTCGRCSVSPPPFQTLHTLLSWPRSIAAGSASTAAWLLASSLVPSESLPWSFGS